MAPDKEDPASGSGQNQMEPDGNPQAGAEGTLSNAPLLGEETACGVVVL